MTFPKRMQLFPQLQQDPRTEQDITIVRRIGFLWDEADVEPLETGCGAISLLCGLILLYPWADTFSYSRAYTILAQIGPEWAWGWFFVALGLLQLFAWIKFRWQGRRNVAFVVGVMWLAIYLCFVNVSPLSWSTALLLYPIWNNAHAFRRLHRRLSLLRTSE